MWLVVVVVVVVAVTVAVAVVCLSAAEPNQKYHNLFAMAQAATGKNQLDPVRFIRETRIKPPVATRSSFMLFKCLCCSTNANRICVWTFACLASLVR